MFDETDQLSVNALRALSIDMIERAGSGHPGLPLDAAPMAYVLYSRHLRVDPQAPDWVNRDRFVLSAGPWFSLAIQHAAFEWFSNPYG